MIRQKFIKIIRNIIILRNIISWILRFLNPGYSYCKKCKLPWNWCNPKSVNYSEYSGTFATCDYCWEHSNLKQLRKYYTETYKKQQESLIGTKYTLDHTLEHLLKCVDVEYGNLKKIRKEKLENLKN